MNRIDYLNKKYDNVENEKYINHNYLKHDLDYFFNKYYIKKHVRKEVIYIIEDVGNLKSIINKYSIDQIIGCITLFVLWSNNHGLDIYSTNLYRREHISRAMYGGVVSGLLEFYRGKDSVKSGGVVEQFETPIIP